MDDKYAIPRIIVKKILLSKRDAALSLSVSVRTIENLMRGRVLPFVKIRRFIRFNVIECDKVMEKHKQRSALL